jgi:hypothetical protein
VNPQRLNSQQRSEFRAFVRDHHPDRGGDPEVFRAGLARFGAQTGEPADERRFDAPIEVVGPLPFPTRVGVALIRTWRRRRSRRVE